MALIFFKDGLHGAIGHVAVVFRDDLKRRVHGKNGNACVECVDVALGHVFCDRAAATCVRARVPAETHGIRFFYQSGMMFIALPSGRKLVYVKPKMGVNRYGSESVTYEGVGEQKKWLRLESYGPKFVENIVQATARDILVEAMRRLEAAGYSIVMHVHDEAVIEAPADASLDDICAIMGQTPAWAEGLLLRADGYVCDFYQKD